MTISTGVAKKVAYQKESSLGVLPNVTGASYVRRTQSTLNLTKAAYESQEIRSDYQVADMRHGARSVSGAINGELAPAAFSDFVASALRKDFAAGATTTKSTIAASDTQPHFVRSDAGVGIGWITDGFRVGDVVRFTGFTGATANNNRNYRILALTEANMTVADLHGPISTATVADDAEGESVVCTVVGKKSLVPLTSHTNDSYTIEHWYSDISVSDVFSGCRVSKVDVNMPATGMSEVSISFLGQDMESGVAQYFTTPAAASQEGLLAAVNGKLTYAGADSGIITGLSFSIDGGHSTGQVVGSNISPDIFPGRVKVTGQLSAYFQNNAIQADFTDENTPSLTVTLSTDNTVLADFLSFTMPKIKLSNVTKSDGESGLTLTANFVALLNDVVAGEDQTTISVQDSTI